MQLGPWQRAIGFLIIVSAVLVALYQAQENRVDWGVTLEGRHVGGLTRDRVERLVGDLAAQVEREPENAYIDGDTGEIIWEKPGLEVDLEGTVGRVLSAQPGQDIGLVVREIEPPITREYLLVERDLAAGGYILLGGGLTEIVDDRPERVNNIKIATDMISGLRLEAGEVFSFNGLVGMPTRDKGFEEAPIITDTGDFQEQVGGGICQVSSTLYQAVLAAGLEVLERHGHSRPVNYTPVGTDATVVPGEKDFSFRNNRGQEIIIWGSANSREVRFLVLAIR